ncbi:MAG: hypothetical protein JST82_01395 [Bacteroidetes bacterium]|nr:hypothetical protein [Bacteroidota bacterium]
MLFISLSVSAVFVYAFIKNNADLSLPNRINHNKLHFVHHRPLTGHHIDNGYAKLFESKSNASKKDNAQPKIYFKLSGFNDFEKNYIRLQQFHKGTAFKALLLEDQYAGDDEKVMLEDKMVPLSKQPSAYDYIISLPAAQCKYYITDIHFVKGADDSTCILYYKINGIAANTLCNTHDKKAAITLVHQ